MLNSSSQAYLLASPTSPRRWKGACAMTLERCPANQLANQHARQLAFQHGRRPQRGRPGPRAPRQAIPVSTTHRADTRTRSTALLLSSIAAKDGSTSPIIATMRSMDQRSARTAQRRVVFVRRQPCQRRARQPYRPRQRQTEPACQHGEILQLRLAVTRPAST